ncbi:flagellar transcriptional regulator FlhD [Geoalkalibacter subterraneus]|uniref:Uncharacterized protein n=1 Tax=Geoalkalibacter subterraneus TaxID=483547 RepID=A0A0B5FL99_9BACT|nr:flagellar transcriptional regulator FlhD [Geoalkalibacter subterraneus]AJF08178.1 hypothetical protein GSUB_16920 [Geoalkalibacter subterraneus]
MDTKYERDIKTLNRRYLMLVREMEREDSDYAHTVTGVPYQIRRKLKDMTIEEVEEMVEHLPIMPFTFRLMERHWKRIADAIRTSRFDARKTAETISFMTVAAALQEEDKGGEGFADC